MCGQVKHIAVDGVRKAKEFQSAVISKNCVRAHRRRDQEPVRNKGLHADSVGDDRVQATLDELESALSGGVL